MVRVADWNLMYEQPSVRPARSSLKPVLFAVLVSFLLGAAAVGYLSWKGYFAIGRTEPRSAQSSAELPLNSSPQPQPSASQTAAAAAVERVAETQGGIDQRLAAAEQRIARLDLQTEAASGNAARAEGLLIAFAARRAIERGSELGYLGDQLRLRFGDAQPNSVATVIEFARRPVTLDVLLARLDSLGERLASSNQQPTFTRLSSELSSLFVIRREATPSPQPSRRLERARLFLESGRVDRAIDEVQRLPGAENAADWLADARRYERARRALDLLETAAVREPRLLRDGAGRPVEQLGPAEGPPPN
jgi:hypothetical protein